MIPKTLSASSLQTYLDCPDRFMAEAIEKASQLSGSAAGLGTALHAAIENMVTWCKEQPNGLLDPMIFAWSNMKAFWDESYWANFTDAKRYKEGEKILTAWMARQVWTGRTVLSMEVKKSFTIKTSIGDLPITYIMDRMDQLDDGSIEVIDYKSFIQPVQPADLKGKIQVRLYALAAQMEHPDAPYIMVVFDLLRYDLVGVRFSKEENRATYRYLQRLAEEIIANNNPKPTINENCQYCIKKGICPAIQSHARNGGLLIATDGPAAAIQYFNLKNTIKALERYLEELDGVVLRDMEAREKVSYDDDEVPGYTVKVKVSARRNMNAERLSQIVGPEIVAKYASITVAAVEEILKVEDLTDEQKAQIIAAFGKTYGEPTIEVKAKSKVIV